MLNSPSVFQTIPHSLLDQIPSTATRVCEVSCNGLQLGESVKQRFPEIAYLAITSIKAIADQARIAFDEVFLGDAGDSPWAHSQACDVVIWGVSFNQVTNPKALLKQCLGLLKPGGKVLFTLPNIQHYSMLPAWLNGTFPPPSRQEASNHKAIGYDEVMRTALDCGYLPTIYASNFSPLPEQLIEWLLQSKLVIKRSEDRLRKDLSAQQYAFSLTPDPANIEVITPTQPITFIVPTNDQVELQNNFLASPIFKPGHPHQILLFENMPSAADALEAGIAGANNELIVYAHQDIYLPPRWDAVYCQQLKKARGKFPQSALFGVYGVKVVRNTVQIFSYVLDRHSLQQSNHLQLPALVDSIDECLFGFYRSDYPGTASELGYHLYATDLCNRLRSAGKETVVISAMCFHHSNLGDTLPQAFHEAGRVLTATWPQYLPIATPCTVFYPN